MLNGLHLSNLLSFNYVFFNIHITILDQIISDDESSCKKFPILAHAELVQCSVLCDLCAHQRYSFSCWVRPI